MNCHIFIRSMGFREGPRGQLIYTYRLFGTAHTPASSDRGLSIQSSRLSWGLQRGTDRCKAAGSGCLLYIIKLTAIQQLAQPWKMFNILSTPEFFSLLPVVAGQEKKKRRKHLREYKKNRRRISEPLSFPEKLVLWGWSGGRRWGPSYKIGSTIQIWLWIGAVMVVSINAWKQQPMSGFLPSSRSFLIIGNLLAFL